MAGGWGHGDGRIAIKITETVVKNCGEYTATISLVQTKYATRKVDFLESAGRVGHKGRKANKEAGRKAHAGARRRGGGGGGEAQSPQRGKSGGKAARRGRLVPPAARQDAAPPEAEAPPFGGAASSRARRAGSGWVAGGKTRRSVFKGGGNRGEAWANSRRFCGCCGVRRLRRRRGWQWRVRRWTGSP